MALKGIQVIELAGLAPGPLCGMILADFGASVIRVDKVGAVAELDCLKNGKRSLGVNLKHKSGAEVLKKLSAKSDVIIEPFRRGVMEGLGLGPAVLQAANPRLVYARLTGFGQTGTFSGMAGHDINYVAMSGVLSMLGRRGDKPTPPVNLLADFGGGGLTCALGVVLALLERERSGLGQVVDAAMVEGTAYLASWLFRSQPLPIWGNERGANVLDSGSHFYDTYETKDGKFMAVGALEPQFYRELIEKLGVGEECQSQYSDMEGHKAVLTRVFKMKTREAWCAVFDGSDACVTPVLEPREAVRHPHNAGRASFCSEASGVVAPNPAPKLSRTPGVSTAGAPSLPNGAHTAEILAELGYSTDEVQQLAGEGVVQLAPSSSKL